MAFVKRETVYRPFLRDLKSVVERFVHLKASGQKRSTEIWGSLYIISRFPLSRGALSLKGGYLLQYYQYIKIGNCYIRVARADGKLRWWEIRNANVRVLILILHPTLFSSRYSSTGLLTWTITGGHSNQDPPYTTKNYIYYTFFANHIWSLLLCSPVINTEGRNPRPFFAYPHLRNLA